MTHTILNRVRYVVAAVDAKELVLETFGMNRTKLVTIATETATKFLTYGWAISYYCVQGDAIREPYIVYEWHYFH
eukprot:3962137-Pleurochrysis_carterae.AAC.1